MGKGSNLLEGRVNVRKLKDGTGAGVRVDGIDVGVLIGSKETGYYWPERPDKAILKRTDAADWMIHCLIDEGRIDPLVPRRDLRKEAKISDAVRQQVFERDRGLCQYCLIQGITTAGTEYDHFVPASAGGSGSVDNVQLACAECNSVKRHWHPRELWGPEWKAWGPLRDRNIVTTRSWKR